MYDKSPDIAALICSRICHDLASPLGAINNGLELLELSGVPRSPEFTLLNESIEAANARIQFFRIAYGLASQGAELDSACVQRILVDYFAGRRTQVNWMIAKKIPRHLVKLLFLLVQCAETVLPHGGTISVSRPGNWLIEAKGQIKPEEPIWQIFHSETPYDTMGPSEVQFKLASDLARRNSLQVMVQFSHDNLGIKIN